TAGAHPPAGPRPRAGSHHTTTCHRRAGAPDVGLAGGSRNSRAVRAQDAAELTCRRIRREGSLEGQPARGPGLLAPSRPNGLQPAPAQGPAGSVATSSDRTTLPGPVTGAAYEPTTARRTPGSDANAC